MIIWRLVIALFWTGAVASFVGTAWTDGATTMRCLESGITLTAAAALTLFLVGLLSD